MEGVKIVTRTKASIIRTPDIVRAFLKEEIPGEFDPEQYIQQLPYENSGFLPIYFFIQKSNLTKDEILNIIINSKSRMPSRRKLIQRLEKNEENFTRSYLEAKTPQASIRRDFKEKILKKEIKLENIDENNIKYLLEAITNLKKSEILNVKKYTTSLLQEIFDKYYVSSKYAYLIRDALCHIDYNLYKI